MSAKVVVDTNILFSALLRADSRFSEIILYSQYEFYAAELLFAELFRHKERIVRASRMPEDQVVRVLHTLLQQIRIFREEQISREHKREALRLCRDVDPHRRAARCPRAGARCAALDRRRKAEARPGSERLHEFLRSR